MVLRHVIATLLVALAIGTACGQAFIETLRRPPDRLVSEAFATPYGRLIVDELSAILRESADGDCLRTKGLDAERLAAGAEPLLRRNGIRMFEIVEGLMDIGAFDRAFIAKAGAGAKAELERLAQDPDVKNLLALNEPANGAEIVNKVAENVDRVALLKRLGLVRRLAPIASGKQELLDADPSERSLAEGADFADKSPSPALKRFCELLDLIAEASPAALPIDRALTTGPADMMPGLEQDLAELCVLAKRF